MCLKKMGYNNVIMESKRGKASPVSGCSMNSVRSQSSKHSPFCPGSSRWTTQSIVTDHMISHYKKICSAKAAVDDSVPKSLKFSVRYNDQIKRERLRAGGHPESAPSLSQRNCLSSCSSTQGRGSMISRPRLNTSFHLKQIVYASPKSRNDSQPIRPSSEMSYRRTPEGTPRRQQSARSSASADTQSVYQTFQDPVQKTYGGDLLHKHSHCFTHDTPFAPKILKSDKNSYLSKYRYYTAPQTKPGQHGAKHELPRQQTYNGSIQADEYSTTEFDDPPQGFSTLHQLSDDECNGLNVSIANKQKRRSSAFHYSSTRASPEGIKSPIMMKTSAEDEELMYLKFLADVTNDILAKEVFADRVLDRVFERHIVMNRHQLDEGEMRHLLEDLRKDLDVPVEAPVSCIEAGRNYRYPNGMRLPSKSAVLKSPERKDYDYFPYTSRITDRDLTEGAVLFMPPHCNSPERTVTPSQESTDGHIKGSGPPGLSDVVNRHPSIGEDTAVHHGVNRHPGIGEETSIHHGVNQHMGEETGVHHGVTRHTSIGEETSIHHGVSQRISEETGVHHGVSRHMSIGEETSIHHGVSQRISEETGVHHGVNRHPSIGEETSIHHGVNQHIGEETGVHHGVNRHPSIGEETSIHHGVNQHIGEETGVHHGVTRHTSIGEETSIHHGVNQHIGEETGVHHGVNRHPSIGEETSIHHGVSQRISEETGVHHGVSQRIGEETGVHHGVNQRIGEDTDVHHGVNQHIGEDTGVHHGVNQRISEETGVHHGVNQLIGEETAVHHSVNQRTSEETGVHHGVNQRIGEETGVHHGVNQRIGEETGIHHNKVTTVAFTENVSQDVRGATSISDVFHHPKSVPNKYDEFSTELEDLGKGLSNTLHVSGTAPNYNNGTTNEKNDFDSLSVSDDEF